MNNWSDLWKKPKNLFAVICVLLIIWGIFNTEQVADFFNRLFEILVNNVLPVIIVIAIIVWIIKKITGGK